LVCGEDVANFALLGSPHDQGDTHASGDGNCRSLVHAKVFRYLQRSADVLLNGGIALRLEAWANQSQHTVGTGLTAFLSILPGQRSHLATWQKLRHHSATYEPGFLPPMRSARQG
jgi:hypothetical protein